MALGYEVNKSIIDVSCAKAVLSVRKAFENVESIAKWLANNPSVDGNDPLATQYGYTADEAYAMRYYFETMDGVRIAQSAAFDVGRKMTGLE